MPCPKLPRSQLPFHLRDVSSELMSAPSLIEAFILEEMSKHRRRIHAMLDECGLANALVIDHLAQIPQHQLRQFPFARFEKFIDKLANNDYRRLGLP